MKVFIVFGTTGEYSDRSEWPVRGFLSKEKAEAFESMAQVWCASHGCLGRTTRNAGNSERPKEKPDHDPGFLCDYTGTDYYMVEVELDEALK